MAAHSAAIRIEMPPRRLIVAKPASSVTSSPANTGRRPRNGGSVHEGGDRRALVAAGRLQLQDLLALEQHQSTPARRRHRLRQRPGFLLELGRLAIVQRERQALVLEQHARVVPGKAIQPGARRLEDRPIRLTAHHPGGKVAALQPVQAGSTQAQRREQPVELLERAAADQGQRAAAGLEEVRKNPATAVPAHAPRPAHARSRPGCRRRRETGRSRRPAGLVAGAASGASARATSGAAWLRSKGGHSIARPNKKLQRTICRLHVAQTGRGRPRAASGWR